MNVVHPVAYREERVGILERVLEVLLHGDVSGPIGVIPHNG